MNVQNCLCLRCTNFSVQNLWKTWMNSSNKILAWFHQVGASHGWIIEVGKVTRARDISWTPCLLLMRNAFFPFFSVSWYFFWLKKLIFVKNYGIGCSWLHFQSGQSYPNWAKVTPIKPENLSSTLRIFPKCLKLGLVEDIMLIYYSKVEIDDILIFQPF